MPALEHALKAGDVSARELVINTIASLVEMGSNELVELVFNSNIPSNTLLSETLNEAELDQDSEECKALL